MPELGEWPNACYGPFMPEPQPVPLEFIVGFLVLCVVMLVVSGVRAVYIRIKTGRWEPWQ